MRHSDIAEVESGLVNLAYDAQDYCTEDGDDVAWLFDICDALYMLGVKTGNSDLLSRLAREAQYKPCLSLRRSDDFDLETLAGEHMMGVDFYMELCEIHGVEVN